MRGTAFERLLGQVYEAAIGQGAWQPFLETVTEEFGTKLTVLMPGIMDLGHGSPIGSVFKAGSCKCGTPPPGAGPDPLMARVWSLPRGRASAVLDMEHDSEVGETPFYRRHLRHHGIGHAIHMVMPGRNGHATFVCLLRDIEQKPFTPEEVQTIEALGPHIDRGVAVAERLAANRRMEQMIGGKPSLAVFLINRAGRPLWMNPPAQALLADAEGITLDGDRLGLPGTGIDLDRRVKLIADEPATPPLSFFVAKGQNRRNLTAVLARPPAAWPVGDDVAAALIISDPEHFPPLGDEILRQQYGLTDTEVSFVAAFLRTQGLPTAAQELGVSWETARRHLKSVFEKTGTHSQVELTHLLLRHPALIVDMSPSAGELATAVAGVHG